MLQTLRTRLTGRSLELELLITACLLLLVGLGTLIVQAGGLVLWNDLAISGAFVCLFLALSLGLALRGWGEDQVLLPLAALLAGIGLVIAGVPGASLIAFAVLILGIVQIGPSLVLIPAIIWSWMTQETAAALLFTAYIVPVNLLDNFLRPLFIGRGLTTPILVILIGLIGGTLAHGLLGLFLGPIVLAVAWELVVAWMRVDDTV